MSPIRNSSLGISAMLSSVRRALILGCFAFLAGGCLVVAGQSSPQANPAKPASQAGSPPQQAGQAQSAPPSAVVPPQQPSPTPNVLRVVVIDPAHGGPDTGARGANGVAEKDIVLEFAHQVGIALQSEGFAVVLTRQGDTDPTADDRATIANGQNDSIFISLHVASSGPMGTVRTYSYLFPTALPVSPGTATNSVGQSLNPGATPLAAPAGFLPWERGQKPFVDQSRKLGDLVQSELAQLFKGSPQNSWSAPVFDLRSVTSPAVAVEVSSVAANPQQLEAMASLLAEGIARAVAAYKAIYPPGGQ
jgi:N-acetylmuramoyl-L-alanine amidase